MNTPSQNKITNLLFNPFLRLAGWPAFGLGLAVILLAGWIGSWSGTHFDGVLDTHTTQIRSILTVNGTPVESAPDDFAGLSTPLWFFLAEGIIDWLALALVLLAAGRLITRAAFRTIDLLGTQALARWPALLAALACLAPGYQRFTSHLVEQMQKAPQDVSLAHPDAAVFFPVLLVTLAATIWMVLLMYRSFSLCCNVRGGRVVSVFIVGLLVAEGVSKTVIVLLAKSLSVSIVHEI